MSKQRLPSKRNTNRVKIISGQGLSGSGSLVPSLVGVSGELVSPFGGLALVGPLLDVLDVVGAGDRWRVRDVRSGFSGGELIRQMIEVFAVGGDCVSDCSVLESEATSMLRGSHRLASRSTLWRFGDGADLGTTSRVSGVGRAVFGRAWELFGSLVPEGEWLTIDPDATNVKTYGKFKQGQASSHRRGRFEDPGLSPLVGVLGETGEILSVRARGGNASPGRALGSFTAECISAIPARVRAQKRIWVRSDSAGFQFDMIKIAEAHNGVFSLSAPKNPRIRAAIQSAALDPLTVWHDTGEDGLAQVCDTSVVIGSNGIGTGPRKVRLIVRRHQISPDEQMELFDLNGYKFFAFITNSEADPVWVDERHRARGGIPEDAIRVLKNDFGMCHAPFSNFAGNWIWWQIGALAHNVMLWLRKLVLDAGNTRVRAKQWRNGFINIPIKIVSHARTVTLKVFASMPTANQWITAHTSLMRLCSAV